MSRGPQNAAYPNLFVFTMLKAAAYQSNVLGVEIFGFAQFCLFRKGKCDGLSAQRSKAQTAWSDFFSQRHAVHETDLAA